MLSFTLAAAARARRRRDDHPIPARAHRGRVDPHPGHPGGGRHLPGFAVLDAMVRQHLSHHLPTTRPEASILVAGLFLWRLSRDREGDVGLGEGSRFPYRPHNHARRTISPRMLLPVGSQPLNL